MTENRVYSYRPLPFNEELEIINTAIEERLKYTDLSMRLSMHDVLTRANVETRAYGSVIPGYSAVRDFGGETVFPSEDGTTVYSPREDKYLVFYNEQTDKRRIRFTLAHEYGHIIMYHLSTTFGGVDDDLYYRYEHEANSFAAEFLAPTVLIETAKKAYGYIDEDILQSEFGLSQKAAIYRLKNFEEQRIFRIGFPKTDCEKSLVECYSEDICSHAREGKNSLGFIIRKNAVLFGV